MRGKQLLLCVNYIKILISFFFVHNCKACLVLVVTIMLHVCISITNKTNHDVKSTLLYWISSNANNELRLMWRGEKCTQSPLKKKTQDHQQTNTMERITFKDEKPCVINYYCCQWGSAGLSSRLRSKRKRKENYAIGPSANNNLPTASLQPSLFHHLYLWEKSISLC